MTKDAYLRLRVQNNKITIMYNHHIDLLKNSVATLSINEYVDSVNAFIQLHTDDDYTAQQYFDLMYEQSVSYFDKKFDVMYVTVEVTKTIKETITILR